MIRFILCFSLLLTTISLYSTTIIIKDKESDSTLSIDYDINDLHLIRLYSSASKSSLFYEHNFSLEDLEKGLEKIAPLTKNTAILMAESAISIPSATAVVGMLSTGLGLQGMGICYSYCALGHGIFHGIPMGAIMGLPLTISFIKYLANSDDNVLLKKDLHSIIKKIKSNDGGEIIVSSNEKDLLEKTLGNLIQNSLY